MRRLFVSASALTLTLGLAACGQAGDNTDEPKGRSVSFDGVNPMLANLAPDNAPRDADGKVLVAYTMKLTLGDVQKASLDFTMKDYGGRDTVPLSEANTSATCVNPDIDDIIPVTFTPTYKDEATKKVSLGAIANLDAEDAEGNGVDHHPQGIGIVWLNTSSANCALSGDGNFSKDFAVTNGYNVTGAIILHGGRDNYKGWKLKFGGGLTKEITNVKGAEATYSGAEFSLLP